MPDPVLQRLKRLMGRGGPPLGQVYIGDLARASPISWQYGYDRGTPIDRYYIEGFLGENAGAIRGQVLEVGESVYSRKFGTGITWQDVLHVHAENRKPRSSATCPRKVSFRKTASIAWSSRRPSSSSTTWKRRSSR
ncbi:hypothetical protein [Altericroceibacterium xinjiangense]|uniref:hypothetical protein n=1 Tax=Altericroceibacterium xinjiangense TaxID=762261 RepID=UPI000F7DF141|nr:hypothetical protein [Altericroceibacterium xinjiangense]